MVKPKILLITKSTYVYRMFCEQITEHFGCSVDLVDGTKEGKSCKTDLILASYREVLKELEFPPDKLLVARRTVDLSKSGDLIALPAGTECLVVNNSLDTARETISCLENLGLNLELATYDPAVNAPPHDVEVAVVAETGEHLYIHSFPGVWWTTLDEVTGWAVDRIQQDLLPIRQSPAPQGAGFLNL
ncbi:hypothetical protein NZD89_23795 [Alicyclobacillus fastidiosus]|uniref:Uncharacterized protein n=1 Tax=Alicyclobacillus fastidiosus TaxID=392011 RepID=A0ABY6ZEG6_9BACL|nr:hypothetical protein [Alicyclobacillus fastidiosus]WAH41251.1 hypothetical protein NZD89_23795 [Alicyclobacillus fastidiosus]GMA62845.1 hypothetical protein GCM10025859_32850 [Alicyclobacillus fastidiosus]